MELNVIQEKRYVIALTETEAAILKMWFKNSFTDGIEPTKVRELREGLYEALDEHV